MARHNSPYRLGYRYCPPYCVYSRYPKADEWPPEEAEDLECPKCGAQEITILEEGLGLRAMIGDLAQCWMCKHEFRITENCWKVTRTYSGGWGETKGELGT